MHTLRTFFLLSAIAYTLPFIAPFYFWWLIFFFPLFLFTALHQNKVRWLDYLIWSLAVGTIHVFPLGGAIIRMTSAPLSVQLLPTALMIIYVAAYPFGLLMGTQALFHILKPTLFQKLCIWTACLFLYLIFVEYALFWPFGRIEGYVFMNPLLPLTAAPSLLMLLHWLPMSIMLLLYCVTTSIISWCAITQSNKTVRPELVEGSHHCGRQSLLRRYRLLLLLLTILTWLLPTLFIQHTAPPSWLNQIGHLPMMLPETMPAARGTVLIAHEVKQLAKQHPNLRIVIMPESSWNGLPLNASCEIPAFKNLSVPHLIIGSFSLENNRHCNSLYWFSHGQRVGRFDKQHAVPFIERIPWGAQTLCQKLFFEKTDPICPANTPRSSLHISDAISFSPYICSELFCNNSPYDPASTGPILAACNDWWFRLKSFRQLMLLAAQLRAIQWNRPILYISFHYAQYIGPDGSSHPLATTPHDHFLK